MYICIMMKIRKINSENWLTFLFKCMFTYYYYYYYYFIFIFIIIIIGFGTLHIFPALNNKSNTPRTLNFSLFSTQNGFHCYFEVRIFLKLLLLFLTPDLLFEFFSRKSTKNASRFKELLCSECLGWFCQLISHVHLRMKQAVTELNKLYSH